MYKNAFERIVLLTRLQQVEFKDFLLSIATNVLLRVMSTITKKMKAYEMTIADSEILKKLKNKNDIISKVDRLLVGSISIAVFNVNECNNLDMYSSQFLL